LPRLEVRDVLNNPLTFYNRRARRRRPRKVHWPAGPAQSIAVLLPGFEQAAGVRPSRCGWTWLARRFRPTSVAAPVNRLRELAGAVLAGEIPAPPLDHLVIAFTGVRHGLLSEEDRDLFWRAYRVPVFEQLLGLGGELLAWECEAHAGLHLVPENVVVETCCAFPEPELLLTSLDCVELPVLRLATGFAAGLDRAPCVCGLNTPRLTELEHCSQFRSRTLVAQAG
jgi:hypothetical protein